MLIESLKNAKDILHGQTILLTGAGGGIGFEAAKAFAYMGANVVIAEIDRAKGIQAEQYIKANFHEAQTEFYEIDLSDDQQISAMINYIIQKYGFVDILFNNATMTAMGNVEDVPISTWDKSYLINFKAPLLLTQLLLPKMKARNSGTIIFVPSSGAAPYMGAYEVFKTAQVELCNTLYGEIEGTNVYTFSIGPGLVKTETAVRGIEIVAAKMGISTDEFYAMNESHILGVEEAGCGFAVSVLLAEKYNGQEIGSIQALLDCDLLKQKHKEETHGKESCEAVIPLLNKIIAVYDEQYAGWLTRNIFERQWVLRDFKKTVGMSGEQYKNEMSHLKEKICTGKTETISQYHTDFEKLKEYFQHQYKLLQGFEKNPDKLKEHSNVLLDWVDTLNNILKQI